MIKKFLLLFSVSSVIAFSQPYPDQFYTYQKDSLIIRIASMNGIEIAPDGKKLILSEGVTDGSVVFKADSSKYPFDIGLPSWNGHSPNDKSSFKVLMRFYKNGWSPWLTIGFWKKNIWGDSHYGATSYNGGKINIDYAVLESYPY